MSFKILLNDHHIPHAFSVAECLPEVLFFVTGWNGVFRPLPKNVTRISLEESFSAKFDALFEDDFKKDLTKIKANKRVFFYHCEHIIGDSSKHEKLKNILDNQCDSFVFPSPHKKETFCGLSNNKKVCAIDFCYRDAHFQPAVNLGTVAGSVHNGCDSQKHIAALCESLSSKIEKFTLIGHANELSKKFCNVSCPPDFENFKSELLKLGVFVYLVSGNAFGMSPIEAMLSGIPVVAGLSTDIRSWIKNGVNCFISPEPSHRVSMDSWLAEKAIYLLQNTEESIRIGKNGRESILDNCSPKQIGPLWKRAFGM
jgi:glycosyltransferase involved in cell wall biosynthesis